MSPPACVYVRRLTSVYGQAMSRVLLKIWEASLQPAVSLAVVNSESRVLLVPCKYNGKVFVGMTPLLGG